MAYVSSLISGGERDRLLRIFERELSLLATVQVENLRKCKGTIYKSLDCCYKKRQTDSIFKVQKPLYSKHLQLALTDN